MSAIDEETDLDFWPDDIRVDVLTPLAILRAQQGLLNKKTGGLLDAKVTSVETGEQIQHAFDVIAPALNRYQERLLTVTHQIDKVYPVWVKAQCFEYEDQDEDQYNNGTETAASEHEFKELVRKVLHSKEVHSTIQSLIARSNEARKPPIPADKGG